MRVMFGHGPQTWKVRVIRDITCSFQWIDCPEEQDTPIALPEGYAGPTKTVKKPCMALFPTMKKQEGGAFVIAQDAAFKYDDPQYLMGMALVAAKQMGMDQTKPTAVRIATVIWEALEDLVRMPPPPERLDEKAPMVGEADLYMGSEKIATREL